MLEKDLSKAVKNYLSLLRNQNKLLFIRNNTFSGKIQNARGQGAYIRQGEKGAPDYIIFLKNKTIFCELKSDKGKLRPEQEEWKQKSELLGHPYWVIRDLYDLEDKLKIICG